MNRFLQFFLVLGAFLFIQNVQAQDEADGFAGISGKGLETTTGGAGGKVITAETLTTLSIYAASSNPYIILIKDTLASASFKEINVGSNTTIVGLDDNATLKNIELHMVDKQNIIIRNLTIRDSYVEGDWEGKTNDNDGVQADNCHHLWIDHCHFSHLGDGLIDLRKVCDYVTVSYCKLSNHNKAFGIGWTEETDFRIGIHHCWIDNTNQRNPSFDMGIGHLYNNYLSNISSYGNLSRGDARIIVENSVFENTKNPLLISDNAELYETNNEFIDCTGNTIGNIGTPPYDIAAYYDYELDPTNEVKAIVTDEAGPQQSVSDQYTSTSAITLDYSKSSVSCLVNQRTKTLQFKSAKEEKMTVNIYSISGKKVLSENVDLAFQNGISIRKFKSGIYIVKMELPNRIETGKIILK